MHSFIALKADERTRTPGRGLLALGRDLNGLLHRVGQRVACPLVHRLHRLYVDVGDHKLVVWEIKPATNNVFMSTCIHPGYQRTKYAKLCVAW